MIRFQRLSRRQISNLWPRACSSTQLIHCYLDDGGACPAVTQRHASHRYLPGKLQPLHDDACKTLLKRATISGAPAGFASSGHDGHRAELNPELLPTGPSRWHADGAVQPTRDDDPRLGVARPAGRFSTPQQPADMG